MPLPIGAESLIAAKQSGSPATEVLAVASGSTLVGSGVTAASTRGASPSRLDVFAGLDSAALLRGSRDDGDDDNTASHGASVGTAVIVASARVWIEQEGFGPRIRVLSETLTRGSPQRDDEMTILRRLRTTNDCLFVQEHRKVAADREEAFRAGRDRSPGRDSVSDCCCGTARPTALQMRRTPKRPAAARIQLNTLAALYCQHIWHAMVALWCAAHKDRLVAKIRVQKEKLVYCI